MGKEVTEDSAGKTVDVEPIIVFPGWYVETTKQGDASDVKVMNPRMLRVFESTPATIGGRMLLCLPTTLADSVEPSTSRNLLWL